MVAFMVMITLSSWASLTNLITNRFLDDAIGKGRIFSAPFLQIFDFDLAVREPDFTTLKSRFQHHCAYLAPGYLRTLGIVSPSCCGKTLFRIDLSGCLPRKDFGLSKESTFSQIMPSPGPYRPLIWSLRASHSAIDRTGSPKRVGQTNIFS